MDKRSEMHRRERRRYLIGYGGSLLLTFATFGVAHLFGIETPGVYLTIGLLGLAQLVLQLVYFLHIDRRRSSREDLHLVLFSTMVLLIMIFGTVWVLGNLAIRMHMHVM
ncbi:MULTISPECIES: cytochrome o ubiquinol/quinol oxidase subunit IV [unclassified Ruegeria]|jgi:cytochrome o ubiquinol oxidase operon protein cyoD|uniref:cytochrome o ubiquinol oxidase subunit IV n=1 Tax=unclassified Ruegeria TaxID=2625375 RepID=UPI0012A92299|nr:MULTISPECIES: cytochrome C oxidase subunit IV family protein [unclassified Ruegeria]QFT75407.1 Cytochrome bo(3) ubiquinol oxidase subunit 4 [Ruegeria sp. THAF33]